MKLLIAIAALVVGGALSAQAQDYHYRSGYVTRNGTTVSGGYQTNPNGTRNDNWSTRGNTNPFTGQPGYKAPYSGGSGSNGYGGSSSGGYNGGYSGSRSYYGR